MSERLKRAALYVRVSTAYQIDRESLPVQREELQNYCRYALGIDSFEIFEDAGYSAKNTSRPSYQQMMSGSGAVSSRIWLSGRSIASAVTSWTSQLCTLS